MRGTRDEETTDGRRLKGLQRRRLLLDATMRLVEREGVAAVSQRRVAAEAGVPPSTVTYYYAAVDDLLVDTLTRVNDTYVEAMEALPRDADPALRGLAELIAGAGSGDGRTSAVAEYELFLLAARRPALRPQIDRWNRAVDAFLAPHLPDPGDREAASATVDGLFVRACTDPELTSDGIHRILNRLLVLRSSPAPRNGPAEHR
ncbi:TetR/AcrR family transcriptional regulator [Nocardiopsis sp. NPDC058631]|uniref:TetR/AcrR family transcriptional regulator n=1 Tax=Nocardiopsis sp. NPDC058631 TaxID=3346566 RepID=UPI00364D7163